VNKVEYIYKSKRYHLTLQNKYDWMNIY